MTEPSTPTSSGVALDRVALVQAIVGLQQGQPVRIVDPALAYEMAHRVKPYVDDLVRLRDAEPAAIEDALAAAEDSVAGRVPPAVSQPGGPPDSPDLGTLSPADQARWIFMDRFVSLDQLQKILRYQFAAADRTRYEAALGRMLEELLLLPEPATCAAEGIASLQRLFASQLLLLRHPFIGDDEGNPVACSLSSLRERYPDFFYRRSRTPNWYESWDFYTEPMGPCSWAVVDTEYLNCSLRSPAHRLETYAKRWGMPADLVQQKTVLEDVYDRVVCGQATGQNVFEQNCSSCTATHYGPGDDTPERWVHTVQRDGKIAIHGRPGVPHWRATRRLWPAVYPVIAVF